MLKNRLAVDMVRYFFFERRIPDRRSLRQAKRRFGGKVKKERKPKGFLSVNLAFQPPMVK
jgi:hypothetical protein